MRRPAAELLFGAAPEAMAGIEGDFALLDRARTASRVWTASAPAVVLGISRDAATEVHLDACRSRGVALIRRASGGGTVWIGPGTLQYAIVLAHGDADPPAIDAVKRLAGRLVAGALVRSGIDARLEADASGDLHRSDRKVGGVALRRHRDATLLHGTLLVSADLELLAAVLRHPATEPAWRRGRAHSEFLANLGSVDTGAFASALRQSLEHADERGQDAAT